MRRLRLCVGLVMMMLFCGATSRAFAQAVITGTVRDSQGLGIPGVSVSLAAPETSVTITNELGSYELFVPQPGDYICRFELDGFTTVTREVGVSTSPLTISVMLLPANFTETVQVSGLTATLAARSLGTSLTLSTQDLTTIPSNGRNLTSLVLLTPGAMTDGNGSWSSLRVQGKSNQQNYLSVDGIDGTFVWDATPGYLTATGSQFRLQQSLEAIEQVDVAAGVSSSDRGLGTGSAITLVTKRGGDAWRGSVMVTGRAAGWNAASPYDHTRYPITLRQGGGFLGGPLHRGRLFGFMSAEGLDQTTELSFTEAVPSVAARSRAVASVQPLLRGFPMGTLSTANPLLDLAIVTTSAYQREVVTTTRVDWKLTPSDTLTARLVAGRGTVDTPDRTVTPRRIDASETLTNSLVSLQSVHRGIASEVKLGFNQPHADATAVGPADYDPVGVSLSGTVTSGSIDARGTTGIARSGLLIRASSASSTTGSVFRPQSLTVQPVMTTQRGSHTLKLGGEYRAIDGAFQFLGSTEVVFNSVDDFLANRPNLIARAEDSPLFHPQQWYAIGFAHDTWRISNQLTFDLGVRYDYYSVVRERENRAAPFFIEQNAFGSPTSFHAADRNNWAPRVSLTYQMTDHTLLRTGYGWVYGPGQFEDRIQPIENMIVRQRVTPADVPGLAYPVSDADYRQVLSVRGTTWQRPDEVSIQYHALLTQEWPGNLSTTVGYIGSRGHDLFLRGVANTLDFVTRRREAPVVGQVDYKTSGCVDGLVVNGQRLQGCGTASYDALQVSATRRLGTGLTGLVTYQYSRNWGTTQGSNEAATAQNTFDYTAEYGPNPQDLPHTLNASVVFSVRGWQLANLFTARSGAPINVTINRPDNLVVNGVTVTNIPGGNTRGTQRPDLVPGVNPYLKNGVRWLNPAAFMTPQPGTFGNLSRNALRGPAFAQWDLSLRTTMKGMDLRLEVFNVTNRLNYEMPVANLPNGTAGVPFTDTTAGTFGYMLGPLNRTLGLGTARQAQVTLRYSF